MSMHVFADLEGKQTVIEYRNACGVQEKVLPLDFTDCE
jgi:hypothetical protein